MYTFNQKLRDKLAEAGIRPSDLARKSGVTKQNIGRLINEVRHPDTNAPPRAERDTVIKIAKALDWDISDALASAELGSEASNGEVEVRPGVRIKLMGNGFTEEEEEEIMQEIGFSYDVLMQRIAARRKE